MTDTKYGKDSTDAAKEVAGTSKGPGSSGAADYATDAEKRIHAENEAAVAAAEAEAKDADPTESQDPYVRADAAGIGFISPVGGESYAGVSPNTEDDPDAVDPNGTPVGKFTIRSLSYVTFDRGYTIKDPASGEFYHPDEHCTSWESCNLDGSYLIPPAPTAAPTKKKAAGADDKDAKK